MEDKNKTKKIIIVLACLLAVVLIGFVIFQNQEIEKLSKGVNSEMTQDDESVEKDIAGQSEAVQNKAVQTAPPGAKASDEIDELEYQLEAAEEELDMAHQQLVDEQGKKAESARNMIELQKKMLQDPAYKKMLRNTYKGQLDTIYGSLYSKLNLSPEKLDQLKELLTDQLMSSMEIGLDTISAAATEEKRKEIQQRTDDLKKENDAKISELLGDQDFQTYESYRDTLSERQTVEMFAESLNEGVKLTEDQKESLIDSMYQERKDLYSQQGWEEERVTFVSEYNDEGIAKMMDMNDRVYDVYVKGAGSTLSESQLEQFKAYLENQRDMTESALEMTVQLYGGQTTQTDTDQEAK